MYSETPESGETRFSPIAGAGQRRPAEASGRFVEQTRIRQKVFRSSFVPLDPLRVILGNITTQRFIANADDVARRIVLHHRYSVYLPSDYLSLSPPPGSDATERWSLPVLPAESGVPERF